MENQSFLFHCKDKFFQEYPKDIFKNHFHKASNVKDTEAAYYLTQAPPFVTLSSNEPRIIGPYVDITKARTAYGALAIPKLLKQIMTSNKILAMQAINTLIDMLHNPEKAREAIGHNVIGRLLKLMGDEDDLHSQAGLACLRVLASQPGAKSAILSNPCILFFLRNLMQDKCIDVRSQAVLTTHTLAENWLAIHALIEKGFVEVLIMTILQYENTNQALKCSLEILEWMLEEGDEARVRAIANDCLQLVIFLDHEKYEVRAATAGVLGQLFRCTVGRMAAMHHNLVCLLQQQLSDPRALVLSKVTLALAFATIEGHCRKQAVNCKVLCSMMDILAESPNIDPFLELATVKVLTNLAELRTPNSQLAQFLQVFEKLPKHNSRILEEHIDILIKTITREAPLQQKSSQNIAKEESKCPKVL